MAPTAPETAKAGKTVRPEHRAALAAGIALLIVAADATYHLNRDRPVTIACTRATEECTVGDRTIPLAQIVGLDLQDESTVDPAIHLDDEASPRHRIIVLMRDGSWVPTSSRFFVDGNEQRKIAARFDEFARLEQPAFVASYADESGILRFIATLCFAMSALSLGWLARLYFRI